MLSLARLGLEVLEFCKTTLDAMAGMYTVRGLNEYHILNMLILFPGIICTGDVWHHEITKSPDTVYLLVLQTHQQTSTLLFLRARRINFVLACRRTNFRYLVILHCQHVKNRRLATATPAITPAGAGAGSGRSPHCDAMMHTGTQHVHTPCLPMPGGLAARDRARRC